MGKKHPSSGPWWEREGLSPCQSGWGGRNKSMFWAAPWPTLLCQECPWKLLWALCTPSLRWPLPCLWVTLALKPPGKKILGRSVYCEGSEHSVGAVTGLPQDWKTSLKVVVPARWGYGKCSGTSPTSPTVTLTILGQSDARLVIVTLIQKNKMKKQKKQKNRVILYIVWSASLL